MNYNEMIEKWAEEQNIDLEENTACELTDEEIEAYKEASEIMDAAIEAVKEASEYYEASAEIQKQASEDYEACEDLYEDAEKRASACEYVANDVDEDYLTEDFLCSEAGEELSFLLEKTAAVYEGAIQDKQAIESYASELCKSYNEAEEVMKIAEAQYEEAMECLAEAEEVAQYIEEKLAGEDGLSEEEKAERKAKRNKILKRIGIGAGIATGAAALAGGGYALNKHLKNRVSDPEFNKSYDTINNAMDAISNSRKKTSQGIQAFKEKYLGTQKPTGENEDVLRLRSSADKIMNNFDKTVAKENKKVNKTIEPSLMQKVEMNRIKKQDEKTNQGFADLLRTIDMSR